MDVSTKTRTNVACGLLEGLEKLWQDTKHCDVTIKVGDQEFPCHRALLQACSPVVEALDQKNNTLDVREALGSPDLSPEIFKVLLRALYTGVFDLTDNNIIRVWENTNKFQITFLVRECEEFIKENITLDNYLNFYEHAKRLGSSTLIGHIHTYMKMNFEHFRFTEEFLRLPADELLTMVNDHDLKVLSEDNVVEAVLKWVLHKPETKNSNPDDMTHHYPKSLEPETSLEVLASSKNIGCTQPEDVAETRRLDEQSERIKYFPKILKAARLFCVSVGFLEELMKNQAVMSCLEALEAVHEALVYRWKGVCYQNVLIPYRACADLCNILVYVEDNQVKMYSLADGKCSVVYSKKESNKKFLEPTGIAAVGEYICLTRYTVEHYPNIDVKKYNTHYEVLNKAKHSFINVGTRQGVATHTILALNGNIVVLRPERVGTVASVGAVEFGVWGLIDVKVHETFRHAAVFQGCILEFFETDGATSVVCHDPDTKRVEDVGRLDGDATSLVCFQDGKEHYILQGNGQIWRVFRTRQAGGIQLHKMNKLWNSNIDVCGAVCYRENLFIFEREATVIWSTPGDLVGENDRKCPAENSDENYRDGESSSVPSDDFSEDVTENIVANIVYGQGAIADDVCWSARKIKRIQLRCKSQVVPMTVSKSWLKSRGCNFNSWTD